MASSYDLFLRYEQLCPAIEDYLLASNNHASPVRILLYSRLICTALVHNMATTSAVAFTTQLQRIGLDLKALPSGTRLIIGREPCAVCLSHREYPLLGPKGAGCLYMHSRLDERIQGLKDLKAPF